MPSKDVICLICPNGCHLTAETEDGGTVVVSGSRCEKGLAFAKRVLGAGHQQSSPKVISGKNPQAPSKEALAAIAAFWGVEIAAAHPHFMPSGSPERTLFRLVVEDPRKQQFLLEKIPARDYHLKLKIIKTLEFLAQKKMPWIIPYLANPDGQYIQEFDDELWQLSPFMPGVPLDRTQYLYEGWRADLLARFLAELKEKARDLPFFKSDKSFSIKEYVRGLCQQVEKHEPRLMPRIAKVTDFLENDFMRVHDNLPAGFCHGDYHPLNIIWAKDDIRAVIDWEFLGMKPEIYDLANMAGCLGIEHPSSLTADLVVGLVKKMKDASIFSPVSWKYFLDFIVALRFAWLSEWLRKSDREMIDLELDYMDLLIGDRDKLRRAWAP